MAVSLLVETVENKSSNCGKQFSNMTHNKKLSPDGFLDVASTLLSLLVWQARPRASVLQASAIIAYCW
jgi:hypothetical protein